MGGPWRREIGRKNFSKAAQVKLIPTGTFSKPWGSRTIAGEAHTAPYNLLEAACAFSRLTRLSEPANARAPPSPP